MFRGKWQRTPFNLNWTIHGIDLKVSSDSEFRVDWSRGSAKGSTDLVKPNPDNRLTFEAHFEIPCTMFVSKSDGTARQKNLKIVLKRHTKKESKVYGKLTIDIARWYGKVGIVKEEIEMESGRAVAPIMSMSYSLIQAGKMMEVGTVDETDLSFVGEPQDRMATALDEWDVTETQDVAERKKKHRKVKKGKKSSHHTARQSSQPAVYEMVDVPNEEEPRASAPMTETKFEEMAHVEEEEKKEKKMTWEPEDLDTDELCKELTEKLFGEITSYVWNVAKTGFIDAERRFRFPPAVFPLFSTMVQAEFFNMELYSDEEFTEILDNLCENLAKAPLCDKCMPFDRFLTYMMVYLLVLKSEQFENARSEKVCEAMLGLVQDATRDVIKPYLSSFEVLVNRFSTAKFEMEPLLDDFKKVYRDVKSQLRYLPSINKFLLNRILSVIEIRILNRMISNPSRFMFKNAVLWNSFLSAFLSDERLEMVLLREAVSAMIMAHGMEADPDMRNDIAPHMDPKLIVFMMDNYHPDEMMPKPVDSTAFKRFFETGEVTSYQGLPEPEFDEVGSLGEEARLSNWNQYAASSSILSDFAFLEQYLSEREPQ